MACCSQVSGFHLHVRTRERRMKDSTFSYQIIVIVHHSNVEKLEKKNYGKKFEMRLFLQLHSSFKPEDKRHGFIFSGWELSGFNAEACSPL